MFQPSPPVQRVDSSISRDEATSRFACAATRRFARLSSRALVKELCASDYSSHLPLARWAKLLNSHHRTLTGKSYVIQGIRTGTGKELVARAIHKLSPVINRNMVNFNCSSVPDSLFESELFGYTRGAFTGAGKDKKGLLEKAHNGTIFLDEIGEMPFPLQAKLLRVVEYHKFRSLGSNEEKEVNVRVIVSTNRNLKQDVEQGKFREDLFYRLNKLQIHIPPLRRREEDIFLLVRHFLKQFNQKFDKKVNGVSQKVQNLFHDYHWPGNVRELENVLESACMLTHKNFIHLQDLPEEFKKRVASSRKIPVLRSENITSLDELEKEYINYVLHYTHKNIKRCAELLNISRTTLYNKLKKHNIQI